MFTLFGWMFDFNPEKVCFFVNGLGNYSEIAQVKKAVTNEIVKIFIFFQHHHANYLFPL